MIGIRNLLNYNFNKFYLNTKKQFNNKSFIVFSLLKNYYSVLKGKKNFILLNGVENIKIYYSCVSAVNLCLNKKIDK